ncbi:hypothetical protein PTTG_05560 [Puccinia triticina 1-1 BBBD Race 1]|uniref:L-ornithine N(5)-monooxygenase [NAD(P)H] n=2 Tax=Puccinia triticina TaxID=208348 RepID=A0A180H081_PUCT1|nr:uncharacterized protein PtA15_9A430 [Puccinia triticina]OAV98400.1 hypothetical protein PTTG_05560 [Puccinia triticina 1-1 BBBD Race 1]WAQ88303.1 hypothetical protein PtA15_9A430 [Puccinia triticina]WAR60476.1 hypothetical protein PtB15_9B415 [Puccinia triticina]
MALDTNTTTAPVQSSTEDAQNNHHPEVFDLIGIGFGPANLSLGVRLAEENLAVASIHQPRARGDDDEDHNHHQAKTALKTCFIESNQCFRWHPGMMIDGSRMQISFLKDLVTLRNPCSPFSFLNYLHCQGRLIDFINRATFTPTRLEFADYLAWVARQVVVVSSSSSATSSKNKITSPSKLNSIDLCYGERVIGVEGVRGPTGDVEFLRVSSTKPSNGGLQQHLCRNLVISVGGTPRVPRSFQEIGYNAPPKQPAFVIHTSTFLQDIDQILRRLIWSASSYPDERPARQQPICNPKLNRPNSASSVNSVTPSDDLASCSSPAEPAFSDQSPPGLLRKIKIAVIGAGQSAAETLIETYNRLKPLMASFDGAETCAELDLLIKQGHLRPSDDSPFSNEVFNPQSTNFFYDLSAQELRPRLSAQSQINGHKKLNDILLKEAAATNYAVVNPETLGTLYETMYSQKVDQGMDRGQFGDSGRANVVKINIINYTDVSAAEANSSGDGSVDVILENVLTGTTSKAHYHAVILGTGYSRQSWKDILFGRPTKFTGSGINLRTLWPNLSIDSLHGFHLSSEHSTDGSPTNSDIVSSGLSDEHDHDSCPSEASHRTPIDLNIARNYRLLLPETFVEPDPSDSSTSASSANQKIRVRKFRPTVWLQGCNEKTHGISDSLLSVLSVRSGEIFDGIQQEGWFDKLPEIKIAN